MSAVHCPRWICDLFTHEHVEVVSEPERLSEQHVRGSGGVVGITHRLPNGRYSTAPLGRFTLGTTYRHVVAFWVRDEKGREEQIRMEGEFAPVRAGHTLTLFVAERSRREGVLVGFVNHATQRHHRLRSGWQTLELLDLPTEETWRDATPVLSTSLRRSRERAVQNATIAAVVGVLALFVGGLVTLIAAGNSAPVGVCFGVLLLIAGAVAGLIGVVQWMQTSGTERPRGVLRHHDFGDEFDDYYHSYRRQTLRRREPPLPPAIDA